MSSLKTYETPRKEFIRKKDQYEPLQQYGRMGASLWRHSFNSHPKYYEIRNSKRRKRKDLSMEDRETVNTSQIIG